MEKGWAVRTPEQDEMCREWMGVPIELWILDPTRALGMSMAIRLYGRSALRELEGGDGD